MIAHALRRFLGTTLASLALATAACGGGSDSTAPDPTSGDVTGTYALTKVVTLGKLGGGGNGLPVTFSDGGGTKLTFKSGTLALGADGSYSLTVDATFKGNDLQMSDEGTYTVGGSSIDFNPTSDPARMSSGSLNGSKMTAHAQFGGIPFEITLQK